MNTQIPYLITESFRGWKQHRGVTLPSLATIFLCTLILAGTFFLHRFGGLFVDGFRGQFQLEVFLEDGAEKDRLLLEKRILQSSTVESVHFVSKTEAYERFRDDFGRDMLELVKENPLPASFVVIPHEKNRTAAGLRALAVALKVLPGVEVVVSPLESAEILEFWVGKSLWLFGLLSAFLLLTLWLIIGNSVRLSLFSRRGLVENMKYCGAGEAFIQFPFILEGILQGLVGSMGAAAVFWTALWQLTIYLPLAGGLLDQAFLQLFSIGILVTFVAALSSFRSVRRFLRGKNSRNVA